MFFILITFLLYVCAIILKVKLMEKYCNGLDDYITANNPQSNADVDRLTRQYFNTANQYHSGL